MKCWDYPDHETFYYRGKRKITWQVVWDYRAESIEIDRSRQENRDRRLPTSTCLSHRADLAPEYSERIIATTAEATVSGYAFQNKTQTD